MLRESLNKMGELLATLVVRCLAALDLSRRVEAKQRRRRAPSRRSCPNADLTLTVGVTECSEGRYEIFAGRPRVVQGAVSNSLVVRPNTGEETELFDGSLTLRFHRLEQAVVRRVRPALVEESKGLEHGCDEQTGEVDRLSFGGIGAKQSPLGVEREQAVEEHQVVQCCPNRHHNEPEVDQAETQAET